MRSDSERLAELKNYLSITYETDAEINRKLLGIHRRARKILADYAGSEEDEIEETEEQLLLDLCRYIWNNAYEDFKTNFAAELFQIRAKRAVAVSETEKGSGNGKTEEVFNV